MKFDILDDNGNVINTIIADQKFVDENYPNHRLVQEEIIVNEPIVEQSNISTLVTECQALLARIVALQGA